MLLSPAAATATEAARAPDTPACMCMPGLGHSRTSWCAAGAVGPGALCSAEVLRSQLTCRCLGDTVSNNRLTSSGL